MQSSWPALTLCELSVKGDILWPQKWLRIQHSENSYTLVERSVFGRWKCVVEIDHVHIEYHRQGNRICRSAAGSRQAHVKHKRNKPNESSSQQSMNKVDNQELNREKLNLSARTHMQRK